MEAFTPLEPIIGETLLNLDGTLGISDEFFDTAYELGSLYSVSGTNTPIDVPFGINRTKASNEKLEDDSLLFSIFLNQFQNSGDNFTDDHAFYAQILPSNVFSLKNDDKERIQGLVLEVDSIPVDVEIDRIETMEEFVDSQSFINSGASTPEKIEDIQNFGSEIYGTGVWASMEEKLNAGIDFQIDLGGFDTTFSAVHYQTTKYGELANDNFAILDNLSPKERGELIYDQLFGQLQASNKTAESPSSKVPIGLQIPTVSQVIEETGYPIEAPIPDPVPYPEWFQPVDPTSSKTVNKLAKQHSLIEQWFLNSGLGIEDVQDHFLHSRKSSTGIYVSKGDFNGVGPIQLSQLNQLERFQQSMDYLGSFNTQQAQQLPQYNLSTIETAIPNHYDLNPSGEFGITLGFTFYGDSERQVVIDNNFSNHYVLGEGNDHLTLRGGNNVGWLDDGADLVEVLAGNYSTQSFVTGDGRLVSPTGGNQFTDAEVVPHLTTSAGIDTLTGTPGHYGEFLNSDTVFLGNDNDHDIVKFIGDDNTSLGSGDEIFQTVFGGDGIFVFPEVAVIHQFFGDDEIQLPGAISDYFFGLENRADGSVVTTIYYDGGGVGFGLGTDITGIPAEVGVNVPAGSVLIGIVDGNHFEAFSRGEQLTAY